MDNIDSQPNLNQSSDKLPESVSAQNSPLTKNNNPSHFQLNRTSSKDEISVPNQNFQNPPPPSAFADFPDDAASIASDVTFRNHPIFYQNPSYNNSIYGTPMAYHRKPVISAAVTPSRSGYRGQLSRPHSSDDLQSNSGSQYDLNGVKSRSPKKAKNSLTLQVVLPSPLLGGAHPEGNFFNYSDTPPETNSFNQRIQPNGDFYQKNGGVSLLNDMYYPYNRSNFDYDDQNLPRSPANSEIITSKTNHTHKQDPSTPQEKKNMFISSLSMTMGMAYGLLNICLGISFYVIDMLKLENNAVNWLAEGFSLYLLVTALSYFLYLILDVSIYIKKWRKYEKLLEQNAAETVEINQNINGTMELNIKLPEFASLKKNLDHRYCFNKDRHSNNFFLKLGAAGFCTGHLIHSLLIIVYRGMSIGSTNSECFNVVTFMIEICYPLYSLVLLFFIFKYSNLIINKKTTIHRLGFMHCISSSLCFWVWTIFRETAEYLDYQKKKDKESDYEKTSNFSSLIFRRDLTDVISDRSLFPEIETFRFTKMCEVEDLTFIYQNLSPYLYPFSVEFSILAVGILVIVWQNIGICKENPDHSLDHNQNNHHDQNEAQFRRKPSVPESNVAIHADCHASNKGLFGGFVVLIFAIVATIVFFVSYNDKLGDNGYMMNRITHATILGLMIVAVIAAYCQIVKLDVNLLAHNTLDNILLLICLPAFFVNTIFSIIPGIIFKRALPVTALVFEIVQILIQTPFMIDGMSRASNSKELRKKKPGRQWVTFLVITNVAMWLMETLQVKSHGFEEYRQDYYSKQLWSIVGHICLPLMMFYRFHSAACLGDVWKFAYIKSGH